MCSFYHNYTFTATPHPIYASARYEGDAGLYEASVAGIRQAENLLGTISGSATFLMHASEQSYDYPEMEAAFDALATGNTFDNYWQTSRSFCKACVNTVDICIAHWNAEASTCLPVRDQCTGARTIHSFMHAATIQISNNFFSGMAVSRIISEAYFTGAHE